MVKRDAYSSVSVGYYSGFGSIPVFRTTSFVIPKLNCYSRYVLICINDLLLITGSIITEMLETKKTTGDLWDFCSIFLGTGNLLVWIGMLRYLGFFSAYNALILTLKGKNIGTIWYV